MRRSLLPSLIWGIFLLGLVPLRIGAATLSPTASFYISPSSGSIGSTFTFDGSASYDQRGFSTGLDYRWDFDYSSGGFSDWSGNAVANHEYDDDGTYTVALEVRDEEGYTDKTYSTVTVYEDAIYEGWFDVDPVSGDTSTVFEFSGNVSSKTSVPASQYQYRWDFDADGDYDTDYSYSKVAYHTYSAANYYNPILQILSPDGSTLTVVGYDDDDEDVSYVYVSLDNETPQASMSLYPSSGTTVTVFYFDGSKSFDNQDRRDLEYRWDFEGDGLFEEDWGSEDTPKHSYELSGTYSPTLQIRDSDGNTDEVSGSITVSESNLPPEAEFTITSDSGLTDKTLGTTSTTFTFNATSSSDEEDSTSALQVRWDFEGDGTYDTSFSDEKRAEHRYTDAGTYTITVQVMDTYGETDTFSDSVTVVENDAPVAIFEVDATQGTPGTTFSFDASDVTDSQYKTSSLQVRWDWDGDGEYDTTFATDKTTTHQYEDAGTYEVILQVKDPEGQTSTYSRTLTVIASTAPTARLTVDETSGTFSTTFHFDASTSSDDETETASLWYRWDFDYTGENDIVYSTSWGHSSKQSQKFTQTGDITIRVEVKDGDGEIDSATQTITLHWASEYMEYLKDEGVIRGYSGGDMKPDQNVTRAELLKMAMEAAGISESGHKYQGYFPDVDSSDWFDSYVEVAYEEGIVSGYSDGSFLPDNSISRAEAMKIILKAFGVSTKAYTSGTFPDVQSADWFSQYVGTAYEYGLVNGHSDGSFYPEWSMTRGEASKIIALAMQGGL